MIPTASSDFEDNSYSNHIGMPCAPCRQVLSLVAWKRSQLIRFLGIFALTGITTANAGVVISLVPTPQSPAGYDPGAVVNVDVLAQLTAGSPTSIRVRVMQFDLGASDAALGISTVGHHPTSEPAGGPIPFWDLSSSNICAGDEASCGTNYAIDGNIAADDILNLTYTGLTSSGTFMMVLNQTEARRVGELAITLPTDPGTYVLDVLNQTQTDDNFGGEVRHGFGTTADPGSVIMRAESGEVTGGQFFFTIVGCSTNEECIDSDTCTDDLCIKGICEYPHNSAPCSDGLPCTVNDFCDQGSCVSGGLTNCSQWNGPCDVASCDPAGTDGNCDVSTPVPNGTTCSDEFFCNGPESCFNGSCIQGEPPCREGLGCFEAQQICGPCIAAIDCYDRFDCTINDCVSNTCVFDAMECEGTCCFPGLQCFDLLTSDECLSFAGGHFLGNELDCDSDPDNDGITGCSDQCPFDSYKVSPGFCGCGNSEVDSDEDTIPDCLDCCPNSLMGESVDIDGCVPFGGCRSSTSSACLDGVDEQFCDLVEGIYFGNGTTCESPCLYCDGRGNPLGDSQNDPTSRFVAFTPSPSFPCESAMRVKLVSVHHVDPPYTGGPSIPFTSFEGQVRWVGPPMQYVESMGGGPAFYASHLQCTPHYQDWSTVGLLHVTGSAIVSSSIYEVENVAASCMGVESNCTAVSAPLTVATARWADVETPYNPPSSTTQPDLADVSALVNKFRNAPGAPIKARALLVGGDIFGEIDIATEFSFIHISACVDAFRGRPYPHTIAVCP